MYRGTYPGIEVLLRSFLDITHRGAPITVRGRWDAGLIAARAATGGRPLGATTTDPGGGSVLELFAHTIELSCMLRAEPAARKGRILTMTTTSTTHT